MYIESFEIKNFKGIKSVKIDVPNPGKNSIVSLIGLNESGKTTILEAISKFVSGDDSISVLYDPALKENAAGVKNNQEDAYQFVPKGRKANFTDNIEISAKLKLLLNTAMRTNKINYIVKLSKMFWTLKVLV